MIQIALNQLQFEYDIHSLVKAFYPEEEVKLCTMEESDGSELLKLYFENDRITGECGMISKSRSLTDTERPAVKNELKRLIYEILAEKTQKTLPWGDMTGIRPTKIPMSMLMQGKGKDEIRAYMKDTYLVSDEKIELGIEITEREHKLLEPIHYEDGYSLYIGIPFCPTTCLYCSFTSYPITVYKKKVADYLKALDRELAFTAEINRNKTLDTIYIGGGTPTTLEPEELDELLNSVERYFDLSEIREFTVESGRPDSITLKKLQVLKKHNVDRISINPQTMKEETLQIIGRRHTVSQTIEAFQLAREAGFTNINMDIIMGLPGESIEDVAHTLQEIKKLHPDSLTVHSLAVKRASRLNQWMEENGRDSMHNTPEMMAMTEKCAREMGLLPYYLYRQKNMAGNFENVGYAASGKEGLYNILIMEEVQTIVACGAGTVTKRVYGDGRIERCDNVKDVDLYINKIEEMIERKRVLFGD